MVAQSAWGPALVHYRETDQTDPHRVTVLEKPERIGEELVTLQPLLGADEGQRWQTINVEYRDEVQDGILAEIWVEPLESDMASGQNPDPSI